MSTSADVTEILDEMRRGAPNASARLLPLVYDKLQGLAAAVFRSQPDGHTLQPTALLHEAWMKLGCNLDRVEDRTHLYRVAAQAMRQVLTDHARAKARDKRGGGAQPVTLDCELATPDQPIDLLEFVDCLERLSKLNERHAKVVELRVLGSLTIAETAEALSVSHGTVEADWRMARAWLLREIGGQAGA